MYQSACFSASPGKAPSLSYELPDEGPFYVMLGFVLLFSC